MKTTKSLAGASLLLILLAACGSVGDILGGGSGQQQGSYEIRGTVDSVDLNSRSIYLTNVSGYTSMLSNGGSAVRVYYDDRTPVDYNGQAYRPADLERGDHVSSIGGSSSTQTATIRGTVRNVDTVNRTIELESTNWISSFNTGTTTSRTLVHYDANAGIYVNGRTESVSGLERGDVIEVRVTRNGSTLWAQSMELIRDVNLR